MRPLPFRNLLAALTMRALIPCLAVTMALPSNPRRPQGSEARPAALGLAWGDLGDGTFANPILPGDFSDIDAIRVGTDYYAITSTFHYSPGMAVLRSKDLVNWRIVSHAVGDLRRIGPELGWDRMDRYGRGIWAGAIRHHAGRFWVYFGTPQEGLFVATAKKAEGPWGAVEKVMAAEGWDDCCPFWDDDGQGYLVASNFADGYKIHLFKLAPDGKRLVPGFDRVLHASAGSEANKLYKIGGTYYHYFSEVHGGRREAMMRRAKRLDGPWETRQLNRVDPAIDREPNQGGLIQVPDGSWWFLTHHGNGAWEGRPMSLLPVTWVEGWPIIGQVDPEGVGTMVWQARKPIAGHPVLRPQTDDDFDKKSLGLQWEWNYQPRDSHWSLRERPGFLRLHSFKPLRPNDLSTVGNQLTQRSYRTAANEVTVKFEVGGMKEGDQAGLSHFAQVFATIGISQSGGTRRIVSNVNGKIAEGPVFSGEEVWLRTEWGRDAVSHFSYSLDGKRFTAFGSPYPLVWQSYRGDRTGIFHYNRDGEGGFVDVDWYRYRMAGPGRDTRAR